MNAVAHCVEALWVADRTPVTVAVATEALRRFADNLPRAVKDGADRGARGQCLAAAWLAGLALAAGSALHHKLAHVLGGYGLPHAETHAIILPHATRFNLAAAPQARERLAEALRADDPAAALAAMVRGFPIPQRLRDVGLAQDRIPAAAAEVASLNVTVPRPVSAADARALIEAAY
jgi:alcohol dehydrogenase class IV